MARTRSAILPRPRGGDWLEDEVSRLAVVRAIDTVVSTLTSDEIAELDLADEKRSCARANGVRVASRFRSRIEDCLPQRGAAELVGTLGGEVGKG